MGKTLGFAIIAISLGLVGAVTAVVFFDFAEETNEELSRMTSSPAEDGGVLNEGRSWPTNSLHVLVETPASAQRIDWAVLQALLGTEFETGETLCVAGCLVPAVGDVTVTIVTPDGALFELPFAFRPAQDPAPVPELPELPISTP